MNTQLNSDKLAMALSFVCALHCLFVPSFFILSTGFLTISLEDTREYTVNEKRIINVTNNIVAENLLKYFDIKNFKHSI